jgi:hypothetical protein
LVDFQANDNNKNNDDITKNTGFEHFILLGIYIKGEKTIMGDYNPFVLVKFVYENLS